jgi:thioredoxin reductase
LLGHDGIAPEELRRRGRAEVLQYGVSVRDVEVLDVERAAGGFEARLQGGAHVSARKLILATGMVDVCPSIEGIQQYYGRGVHHCPICDGFEVRDFPVGVLGSGDGASRSALQLLRWSPDLVLFTHGPSGLSGGSRALLDRHGVVVREERVARLSGERGELAAVVLESGEAVPRRALFLKTGLGCKVEGNGIAEAEFHGSTSSDGVFVVGDASPRVQLVAVAAAEGAAAAVRLNAMMQDEDLGLV